jgi:hypothetical protein
MNGTFGVIPTMQAISSIFIEVKLFEIVSMNGYWSTSRNEQVATMFGSVGTQSAEVNHESVLFEVNIDLHGSKCVFGDISRFSWMSDEEEVLFDLDATFIIESVIEENENDIPYWRIRMNAVNDDGMACMLRSLELRRLYD